MWLNGKVWDWHSKRKAVNGAIIEITLMWAKLFYAEVKVLLVAHFLIENKVYLYYLKKDYN